MKAEEIKFKAQSADTIEWVYGFYCELAGRKYIIPDYSQFRDIHDPDLENSFVEIIPETVGQYWRTINGQDLYEGDIFQYSEHPKYLLPDFTGEILFMDGCFGYVPTSSNRGERFHPFSEIDELEGDFLNHIEIVDNIHDKQQRKQAPIDMMRGDEEIGLYDDKPKNHGYER